MKEDEEEGDTIVDRTDDGGIMNKWVGRRSAR